MFVVGSKPKRLKSVWKTSVSSYLLSFHNTLRERTCLSELIPRRLFEFVELKSASCFVEVPATRGGGTKQRLSETKVRRRIPNVCFSRQ